MGGFGDFFLGSKPDMQLPGYVQPWLDQLNAYKPKLGKPGQEYKHIVRKYDEDPASLAATSMMMGAHRNAEIDEDYSTGANQILAQGGGEQATVLQHMKDGAKQRAAQDTGEAAINESTGKYFTALGGWQNAAEAKRQAEMQRFGLAANFLNMGQDMRRKGGMFSADTIGSVMAGFAQGAGSAAGTAAFA